MTAMPQLVSLFNAVGGGAAALIAIDDYLRLRGDGAASPHRTITSSSSSTSSSARSRSPARSSRRASSRASIPRQADLRPGGQLVTAGPGAPSWSSAAVYPVRDRRRRACAAHAGHPRRGPDLRRDDGPADRRRGHAGRHRLLNSFTGTAVAMAGFVIDNPVLIIAGALVGASGAILTKLMADAMNRSVLNIMIGGFGGGEGTVGATAGGRQRPSARSASTTRPSSSPTPSTSSSCPGYGLAVAQAQHAVPRARPSCSRRRGVDVKYAIHPVAGRMPGHMNVLLAEANVPYPQLKEMEDINPEFARCDVALVIGANDVTNPAARRPGSPVSGMPILDVDQAKSIVVIKRSMGRGYAGIDNELYTNPKTGMLFADAKDGLARPRERGEGALGWPTSRPTRRRACRRRDERHGLERRTGEGARPDRRPRRAQAHAERRSEEARLHLVDRADRPPRGGHRGRQGQRLQGEGHGLRHRLHTRWRSRERSTRHVRVQRRPWLIERLAPSRAPRTATGGVGRRWIAGPAALRPR